ncbi:MAG: DUF1588 domain-containing protein [Pseudomonadota bacterium]
MNARNHFVRIALSPAVAALLCLAACQGQVGGSGPGAAPPGGSTGGVGATGGGASTAGSTSIIGTGGGTATVDCAAPHAPALHARLLTPSQYDNTVTDLVKVGGDPSKDFGGGAATQLDDLGVELRANAAASIAHQAALSLSQWSACAATDATCEQQIIDKIGPEAYRHPLAAAERQELQTLFDAGVKEKDFATGVEWFLTGVLQSPDFLYQLSKLQAGEQAGQLVAIPPYELASRLSYFIWDSTPDDALYAAASTNDLSDAGKLGTQMDRMLKDSRFLRGITGFYSSYLRLGSFREVARDDAGFSTDIVAALRTSLLMSATQLYQGSTPANVAGLFSGSTYYLNGALRSFYGLAGTDTAFTPADMASEERHGILTHPALMALLARPDQSNPISRGLFVRRTILCQDLPPPPTNVVIPPLPPVAAGLSTRERLDQHTKAPLCASCHTLIDPPGFALENFDQVGRHRSVDSGISTDTSGTMTTAGDLNGDFAKGSDLLTRIAQSQDVKGCFAQKYFEYAVSRVAAADDACSVDRLKKSFVPSGDLLALVASIANTDSFRFRKSEGAL